MNALASTAQTMLLASAQSTWNTVPQPFFPNSHKVDAGVLNIFMMRHASSAVS